MEKQITWSIRFIALFICSLSFLNVHAQKNTNVKGTVYDSNNEPLVGATVSVKGNSSNGRFFVKFGGTSSIVNK